MFTIQSTTAIHKGETKFYQVYVIYSDKPGSKAVVVNHWGAHSPGADMTPASHGQSQWAGHDSLREARKEYGSKVANKKKRGYEGWEDKNLTFTNERKFKDSVIGIFGKRSSEILAYLKADIEGDGHFQPDEDDSYLEQKAKQLEEPIDRGELWAQW